MKNSNFTLTKEQQAKVNKILAEGDKKYAFAKDIIWESEPPAEFVEMWEKELEEVD